MIGGCDDDPQEQDQKEEKRKVESEGSDETGGNVNGGVETTGAGWEKLNVGSEVMSNTKQDSDSGAVEIFLRVIIFQSTLCP